MLPPAKFSTLMTRSAVYSSVSFSALSPCPLLRLLVPPMVPWISKGLVAAAMGMALSLTLEPPSSKLDW
jgi:hypothetical protein